MISSAFYVLVDSEPQKTILLEAESFLCTGEEREFSIIIIWFRRFHDRYLRQEDCVRVWCGDIRCYFSVFDFDARTLYGELRIKCPSTVELNNLHRRHNFAFRKNCSSAEKQRISFMGTKTRRQTNHVCKPFFLEEAICFHHNTKQIQS